jgi:hypothetical protein
MRLIVLFSLLMLTACTIRAETFSPRDNASGGLSFTPLGLNTPVSRSGDGSCPGVFARGSDMQDVRDGTQDLFCD